VTLPGNDIDWNKGDGLVPAIVQHGVTGRVLMLGYMNDEALAKTQTSGLVTFYSRSRNCLWTKGETSGNKWRYAPCYGDSGRAHLPLGEKQLLRP